MQTFLPFSDFAKSASVLDYRRLGSQRKECAQLIDAIENGAGWSSHPAAHMWTGHVPALKLYMDAIIREWVEVRGYKNNYEYHYPKGWWPEESHLLFFPPWLGDEEFHSSHRRALLLKSEYYDQFDWSEADALDWDSDLAQTYWWPRYDVADADQLYVLRKKGDY